MPSTAEQSYPVQPEAGWPLIQEVAGVLHAPQLAVSVFRFASQPLLGFPSQLSNLQGTRAMHVLAPYAMLALQATDSTMALTQEQSNQEQDSSPYPVLQVPNARCPFTQAAAALLKGVAGVLHAPQLAVSVFKFASQPLLGLPSQLPNLQGKRQML
jgi:hypothetical protein